jgi:hypothetical protein
VRKELATLLFVFLAISRVSGNAQDQARPLDGPKRILHDELLEQMIGSWNLTGKIMGQIANHSVEAGWVLDHQFLRIHEVDAGSAPEGVKYEAMVFVGYDNASERYVVHWLDVYGGRFSETLGYGRRSGDSIEFVFEYPDGPFHTTFSWNPETKTWQWRMRTKDKVGKWIEFGDMSLIRKASQSLSFSVSQSHHFPLTD